MPHLALGAANKYFRNTYRNTQTCGEDPPWVASDGTPSLHLYSGTGTYSGVIDEPRLEADEFLQWQLYRIYSSCKYYTGVGPWSLLLYFGRVFFLGLEARVLKRKLGGNVRGRPLPQRLIFQQIHTSKSSSRVPRLGRCMEYRRRPRRAWYLG